jgi:hypothetical protein
MFGWQEALHPEYQAPTVEALRESFNTGKPINVVHRVKMVNGGWKWLRARGLASYGPSEKIVRWYGGCEDIDEFKKMEAAQLDKRAGPPTQTP